MLSQNHTVRSAFKGDLLVDEKYILEIGGKNKKYKQIKDLPHSYIVADDLATIYGTKKFY